MADNMQVYNVYGEQVLNRLQQINRELLTTQTRLATGKRIVEAGQGPVEITISKSLEGIARRWAVAGENVRLGYSVLSIAETGVTSIQEILTRMGELTTQAASDLLSEEERQRIQQELQSLASEINQTVEQTRFRGLGLLTGEFASGKQIWTGPSELAEEAMPITIGANAPGGLYWEQLTGIPVSNISVATAQEAQQLLERISQAQGTVGEVLTEIGKQTERLAQKEATIPQHRLNVLAAQGRISNADMAREALNAATQRVLQNVATTRLAQANRVIPENILRLLRG